MDIQKKARDHTLQTYTKKGRRKIAREKRYRMDDGISRKFSDGRKITGCLKMRMFEMLVDNPDCQTRLLIEQIVEIEDPFLSMYGMSTA